MTAHSGSVQPVRGRINMHKVKTPLNHIILRNHTDALHREACSHSPPMTHTAGCNMSQLQTPQPASQPRNKYIPPVNTSHRARTPPIPSFGRVWKQHDCCCFRHNEPSVTSTWLPFSFLNRVFRQKWSLPMWVLRYCFSSTDGNTTYNAYHMSSKVHLNILEPV